MPPLREDLAAAIPVYVPDRVGIGRDGVVCLLSRSQSRIFRWSAASGDHLNPTVIGPGARDRVYSGEADRIYVGYQDGRITWIDPAAPAREQPFGQLHSGVYSLSIIGRFVFGSDDLRWSYVLGPDGAPLQRLKLRARSYHYEWSPANSRIYLVRDGDCWLPHVMWFETDPVVGSVQWGGHGPYQPGIVVGNPLRVEANGDRLLDATGQVWDARSLEIVDSLPWPSADAIWDASRLLVLRGAADGTSRIERRDPVSLADWGSDTFEGGADPAAPLVRWLRPRDALRCAPRLLSLRTSRRYRRGRRLQRRRSVPARSGGQRRFRPRCGADAWNAGHGPGDSAQGLILDAYPIDFACQLPEHGVAGTCDFDRIVPSGPGQPVCATDRLAGGPASGSLVVQDVFGGRLGFVAPLAGTPVDLELDPVAKRVFVALQDGRTVEQVDLVSGRKVAFAFPDPVRAVRLDVGSKLVVSTTP